MHKALFHCFLVHIGARDIIRAFNPCCWNPSIYRWKMGDLGLLRGLLKIIWLVDGQRRNWTQVLLIFQSSIFRPDPYYHFSSMGKPSNDHKTNKQTEPWEQDTFWNHVLMATRNELSEDKPTVTEKERLQNSGGICEQILPSTKIANWGHRKYGHKYFFSFNQEYLRFHDIKFKTLPLSYQSFSRECLHRHYIKIEHSSIIQDWFVYLEISFEDDSLCTFPSPPGFWRSP